MSLLVYVGAFLMVSGIIAGITTFFYSNYSFLNGTSTEASEYNKLNLCFLEEIKQKDLYVYSYGNGSAFDETATFEITAENQESKGDLLVALKNVCDKYFNSYALFSNADFVGFREDQHVIYYNQTVLCSDVQNFSVNSDYSNGREVFNILVQFQKKSFSNKYIINR